MEEMVNNWAVIIPVHQLKEGEAELLQKAVNSYLELNPSFTPGLQVIVTSQAAYQQVFDAVNNAYQPWATNGKFIARAGIQYIINTGNTSFQGQINKAVAELPDYIDYFTILEFDDLLRKNYGKYTYQYTKEYPDTSVFLPLIEEVDASGSLIKYSNEVLWTPNFTENLGVLDHDALTGFANFHLTGALINKADYLEVGGLKESMELTFNYEFLLRATQRGKVVRSIPKVIYTHLDARPGSLFASYTQGRKPLSEEEVRFWFDTAQKECVFTEDRKVTFMITPTPSV